MKSMIIGTIVKLERLNNSVWGNPRYQVTIKDESGQYCFKFFNRIIYLSEILRTDGTRAYITV